MAYTYRHGDRPLEGVTIQRAVGRGGFGEVYYALTDSGKQIAVKYLRDNPEVELRGISHVLNLKSPHLISVYDVKQNAEGEPFVIMEYVSGPSLRDLLAAEPKGLGPQKAAFILNGIAQGLSYLHERGIVHRDLKPANIFYDDGYVKIGDYGLSKHISVSQHSGQTVSVGTVHYMAPEIGSGSYSKAIDIYALGVILFEMLTGKLPFTGSSMGEILMRHLSERPDLSGLAEPFAGIVRQALAKDPRERFQDASEMMAVLRESVDFSASVAGFDASVFSNVPRAGASDDPTRTGLTPGRPAAPVLDARDAGRAARLEQALDAKTSELHEKLARKAGKIEEKLFRKQWKGGAAAGASEPPAGPAENPLQGKSRILHALVVCGATLAAALVIGMLSGRRATEERVVFLFFGLVSVSAGAIFAHLVCLPRIITRSPVLDRIAYGSLGALFMAPFLIGAYEETPTFAPILLGPLAALIFCDFGRRIEAGRRGSISGSDAIWPAIVGMIAAGIADAERMTPWAGAVTGLFSMLVQAAAAMWPAGARAAGMRAKKRTAAEWQAARPADAVRAAEPNAGAGVAASAAALGRNALEMTERALREAAVEPQAAAGSAAAPAMVSAAPRREIIDPDGPSFVGRATNAGLSFVGKLMLLFGMATAIAYTTLNVSVDGGEAGVRMDGGTLVVNRAHRPDFSVSIPRVLPLVPIMIGSLALLAARRHDGGWHFLRGFVGCSMLIGAGIVALAPATDGLKILFSTRDWSELDQHSAVGPIVGLGVLTLVSAALLLWPQRRRNRHTIVV